MDFARQHSDETRAKMRKAQQHRRVNELLTGTAIQHPQLVRSMAITSRLLQQQAAQTKEM